MLALRTSPAGFPMAPSAEEWEALVPAERRAVVAALPGEVTDAKMSPPEGIGISRPRSAHFSVLRAFVVVDFKPGGAARLFDVPLAEACDHLVDLADVWGPGEASLRERILDAQDVACKLAVVAAALERHLDRTPPDASMIRAATALGGGAPVPASRRSWGFFQGRSSGGSARRPAFRDLTGMTPTEYRPASPSVPNHVPVAIDRR